jgi:hypothetical protein
LQPGGSGSASIFFLDLPFRDVRDHAPFFATHGELDGRHPRGFGSYPRVLGRYVRERGVRSLEEAVRKMTSLAADHLGLTKRGRLVPGAFADLVLGPEYAIFFAALGVLTAIGIPAFSAARSAWARGQGWRKRSRGRSWQGVVFFSGS